MLSLLAEEIEPIAPVLKEFDPKADTSQIGSWGLLYIVCGTAAGQSLHWRSTIPDIIPTGYPGLQELRDWLSGKPAEIDIAIGFTNLVQKWAQDIAGIAIARTRLANLERNRGKPFPDNWREHYLNVTRIAIMLNSVSSLNLDDLRDIRTWASQHDEGWARLFYAGGILLSAESTFPSSSVASGLLMFSHSAKDKVKKLLEHYSHRDYWRNY
jgi:hypothetical protein